MRFLSASIFFSLLFSSCKNDLKEFNGKENSTVTVSPGTTFSIVLPEDHAAGQNWLFNSGDNAVAEYKGSSYRGAKSGLTDFIFESKKSGEAQVSFRLIEYSHPVDTTIVTIRVQ